MASKRTATSDLNHDNWDQEVEVEEAGTFNKASEDVLKRRVFKTAKRRMAKNDEGSQNIFSQANLVKFTPTSLQPSNQIFGFLSKIQPNFTNTNGSEKDSEKITSDNSSTVSSSIITPIKKLTETEMTVSITNKFDKCDEKIKETPLFCFGNKNENDTKVNEKTSPYPIFNFENQKVVPEGLSQNAFNNPASKSENSLNDYYSKLKGLNQSVATWINKHVNSNPLINLQPIFKDYEKFFDEIEKEKNNLVKNDSEINKVQSSSLIIENSNKPLLSFQQKPENKVGILGSSSSLFSTTECKNVNIFSNNSDLKLNFGNKNLTFGSGPIGGMSKTTDDSENKEELSDEPPKLDIKQVEEEGHIYSIRCKLFIKKEGNFVEKGIGSLYLKPVEGSDKMQVIVRAHNSLGNVLSNFILSKSIPTQRMGKNNIMIVCIPTPESQPPPVPVLIKVKTEQDADSLLKTLEDNKK